MDPLSGAGDAAAERAEAAALLTLQAVEGIGDRGVKRLREVFPSGRAALDAADRAFAAALAGEDPTARHLAAARARGRVDRARVGAALEAADARGITVVPMGGRAYPTRLLQLYDPPPVLFLRGRVELLDAPAVAIVGARRATPYGRRAAAWLGGAIARAGVAVVSGLALGIDAEAHRAALDARGPTVAVLGTGADRIHPRTNTHLQRAIARSGLLVSEFAPGTPPLAHHFPKRNRIMAALARAIVVVEAAEGSGSLITVDHGTDLGRDVFAVPGPIDAPTSRATNQLIAEGVEPALGPEVILEALGIDAAVAASGPPPGTDRAAVWEVLAGAPLELDEVAGRAGLSAHRALAAVSLLELEGWAVQSAGCRFARRP